MTRINCVPPSELTTQHLIAEYRELPRIFALVRAAIDRGERPNDGRNPTTYRLGAGHVRFFYPRLAYLVKRQTGLIDEMLHRGYSPNFTDPERLLSGLPGEWCGDWTPSNEDLALNRARIAERLGAAR